jgi:dienelactone hydrolase
MKRRTNLRSSNRGGAEICLWGRQSVDVLPAFRILGYYLSITMPLRPVFLCHVLLLSALLGGTSSSVQSQQASLRTWQDTVRFFDYPPVPFARQDSLLWRKDGVQVRAVSFASPVQGRVTGYLVQPDGPGPFAAIVFGHWGPGNATEFLPEATAYARAGAASLLIDYPWVRQPPWRRTTAHGLSDPETDRDVLRQAVIDLRRGLDLLLTLPVVDRARIGYVGHSYGAQWGAILSAVDDRFRAVTLMAGVGATSDIYRDGNDPDVVALRQRYTPKQLDRYFNVIGILDAVRYAPHAAPTPLLMQFARHERSFSMASMERYARAASEPKTVRWYDTGHELNDPQAWRDRTEWMAHALGLHLAETSGHQ